MRPRHQLFLEQLAEPLVRAVALVANATWVVIVALGLLTNETVHVSTAWPAVILAIFSMGQLLTGRTDVRVLLVVCTGTLAVAGLTTFDAAAEAPFAIALTATGIGLSLFVSRRLVAFVATYSAGLILVVLWRTTDFGGAVLTALTSAIVFSLMSYLVRQLTLQSDAEIERFGSLFYHSPIALWEEDFTGVERFLTGLREGGMVEFEEYLATQPDAALRIAGLIDITAANDAAVQLLEAGSANDVLGQLRNRDIESIDAITDQLVAVWEGANHIVTEIPKAKTMRGRPIHLALSWTAPLIAGRPDYRHISVAAIDVTESRAARTALEGLLRSKDELVATVSHELRTPLTTVVGLAAELSESMDSFEESELRELVSLIASEGREVSTIVEDLLVAAQSETGKLRLIPERVDLVALATEVHRALPQQETVALYVPAQPVWAVADPMRTRQIVRNLIVNANRYGGPNIRICVTAASLTATIEVRDSGPPLPFREREAIFDRFYRARQVPGLTASVGLGLTVSRQLARDMDGDLTYSHDGDEAIFELSLPTFIAEPRDIPTQREAAG